MSYQYYYPAHDIDNAVAKSVKQVFMNLDELKEDMPGFDVTTETTAIVFPTVGVDFRTVNITGDTGDGMPVVFTPDGFVARVQYPSIQKPGIHVDDYQRYTTYFVGDPRDISFDLFTYYGDPNAASKQIRHMPLAFPQVNHVVVQRNAGMGESALVYGTLAVYSSADSGGMEEMKHQMRVIYNCCKNHTEKFGELGLQSFRVQPPKYTTYKDGGLLFEGLMDFFTMVRIQ